MFASKRLDRMKLELVRLGPLVLVGFGAVGCARGVRSGNASAGISRSGNAKAVTRANPSEQDQPAPVAVPADLRRNIDLAEGLGQQIYLQDKASAIGTDALMERVKSLNDFALGGFLTVREADASGKLKPSFQVMFFTRGDDPRIVFRVHVPLELGSVPMVDEMYPPSLANEGERLLIRGRQTALDALRQIVQPINPVVLPGDAIGEEGILVYLLAGTTRPNVAVFGRHYRVLVSSDGRTVKRFEPLSKAVLEIPTEPSPGGQSVVLAVSHLVTDYPLETHVFTSMLHGIPVFVATARGNWQVDGNRISFLGRR